MFSTFLVLLHVYVSSNIFLIALSNATTAIFSNLYLIRVLCFVVLLKYAKIITKIQVYNTKYIKYISLVIHCNIKL